MFGMFSTTVGNKQRRLLSSQLTCLTNNIFDVYLFAKVCFEIVRMLYLFSHLVPMCRMFGRNQISGTLPPMDALINLTHVLVALFCLLIDLFIICCSIATKLTFVVYSVKL
jgi:hypothetical protein